MWCDHVPGYQLCPHFRKAPHPLPGSSDPVSVHHHGSDRRVELKRDTYSTIQMALAVCGGCTLPCTGSRGAWDTCVLVTTDRKAAKKREMYAGSYNPTTRSTAPTRMPNMDVDADSIPKMMYPTIAPIFNGVYVRLRFNLRIMRKDFVSGDICGLFCLIRIMWVHLIACAGNSVTLFFRASIYTCTRSRIHHHGNILYLILSNLLYSKY